MARSPPFVLVLALIVFVILSSLNVLHRLGPSVLDLWNEPPAFDALVGQELANDVGDVYNIGVGKGDITGPVCEINFMGYADQAQSGTGLRQRLYSRAFIIESTKDPKDRFAYLVLDTQSGDTAVRHGILQGLKDLGDEYAVYGQSNVAVTGTHSHSGPGAWLNYLLPQITSKGFHKPSYDAIVDGALASIKQAHDSLAPGHLGIGNIEIEDANINRSPWSYLQNPSEERERYEHDVDKTLTLLRFTKIESSGLKDIGVLTWFAVHGTSMLGNNTLVTGDNKGVAAGLFEQSVDDDAFVAGFSQSNVGDTSPNVLGAFCESSGEQAGLPCDFETSLCEGKTQKCHGRGPHFGRDDAGTASTYEIGLRQFNCARKLFDDKSRFTAVRGAVVRSVHQFADLSGFHFELPNGTEVRTCPGALGYSFPAGTSDWPGAFDFKQGQPNDPHANPLWNVVRTGLHPPNKTQRACHREKPILLDVGEAVEPYDWTPNIVDIQLFRVGQLFMIISPGEATTMAGRRWREALEKSVISTSSEFDEDEKPLVVLGGPGNTYAHYITTPEEYSVQRYEGASTLYGPWTLDAYINLTLKYLPRLFASASNWPPLGHGPKPPIFVNKSLIFITPVVVGRPPFFKSFGEVLDDVNGSYHAGDTIRATFVGANPRNNFRLGGTFAAVEKYNAETSAWEQVKDDGDWDLVYEWKRTSSALGTSEVTILWETKWANGDWKAKGNPSSELPHGDLLVRDHGLAGKYRLRYYGDSKALGGKITAFEGTSGEFMIF